MHFRAPANTKPKVVAATTSIVECLPAHNPRVPTPFLGKRSEQQQAARARVDAVAAIGDLVHRTGTAYAQKDSTGRVRIWTPDELRGCLAAFQARQAVQVAGLVNELLGIFSSGELQVWDEMHWLRISFRNGLSTTALHKAFDGVKTHLLPEQRGGVDKFHQVRDFKNDMVVPRMRLVRPFPSSLPPIMVVVRLACPLHPSFPWVGCGLPDSPPLQNVLTCFYLYSIRTYH